MVGPGSSEFPGNSPNRLRIHATVLHASDAAMYSASDDDSATHFCFREKKDTMPPFSVATIPDVDRLSSWSPAQFESQYTCNPLSRPKTIPKSTVPFA